MAVKSYMDMNAFIADITGGSYSSDTSVRNMLINRLSGVEGIPYQFMENVDARIANTPSALGRKYSEKIISRIPLLMLTPCEPEFAKDFNAGDRSQLINKVMSGGDGYVMGNGRYYTPKLAYADYWKTVNIILGAVAQYIGIYDDQYTLNGTTGKIGGLSWQNELNNSGVSTYFSNQENVIFYLDGLDQVSESYSTETTESSIAGMINGFSSQANELQFLMGGSNTGLAGMANSVKEAIDSGVQSLTSAAGVAIGGGIIGSLADGGISTVINGGKITFPQIWSDSSNDKSYSIDIKLRSPDHDNMSIFMNILKPYCKLLALALPRTMEDAPNGYRSPFLVRAFSKGIFGVDMGVISSMTVTKGATCCWNDDGLPTQIDINITIQDLYNNLSMPDGTLGSIMANPTFINYLANLSGLNVGTLEITNKGALMTHLISTAARNVPSNLYTKFQTGVSNVIGNLYDILN